MKTYYHDIFCNLQCLTRFRVIRLLAMMCPTAQMLNWLNSQLTPIHRIASTICSPVCDPCAAYQTEICPRCCTAACFIILFQPQAARTCTMWPSYLGHNAKQWIVCSGMQTIGLHFQGLRHIKSYNLSNASPSKHESFLEESRSYNNSIRWVCINQVFAKHPICCRLGATRSQRFLFIKYHYLTTSLGDGHAWLLPQAKLDTKKRQSCVR